ncbi:hypothetical protein [Vibrio alginolyticus]|uniref:hypothetical protein n=1 Tax=Vibrio alginolyticus TaxID=663 RepID=UPI003754A8E9
MKRLIVCILTLCASQSFAALDKDKFNKDMDAKGYSFQGCTLLLIGGFDVHRQRLTVINLKNVTAAVLPKMASDKIMILEGGKYYPLDIQLKDDENSTVIEFMTKMSECSE